MIIEDPYASGPVSGLNIDLSRNFTKLEAEPSPSKSRRILPGPWRLGFPA